MDGHQVSITTFYGLRGQPLPWVISDDKGNTIGKVMVYPAYELGGDYGSGMLRFSYERFQSDILITCSDVWVYRPESTHGLRFCPWFPVDYDPAPDGIIDALQTAIYPISESKWGQRVLDDAGIKADYIPCSFPTDVFKPYDREESRRSLGIPKDCDYLVLQVAANKDPLDRKGLAVAITAFAEFVQSHPGAKMMIHTNWGGPINILDLVRSLGIEDRVIQPDQYAYIMGLIDTNYMAKLYSAADVLVNSAESEGFGFPIVEAQLCGTPVIATDYSSTDEVLSFGWKIPVYRSWVAGPNTFRSRCRPGDIAAILEEAYRSRRDTTMRDKARQGVLKYDTKRVHQEYWRPAFSKIQSIIDREASLVSMMSDLVRGSELPKIDDQGGTMYAVARETYSPSAQKALEMDYDDA